VSSIIRWLTACGLLWLSGCVTPLTPAQRLSGVYVAKETGDVFTFSPDESYTYTLGGPDHIAWHGFYYYEDGNLRLTYALSAHVKLWETIQLSEDKSRLTIICGRAIGKDPALQAASPYRIGNTLHLIRQPKSPAAGR
jgi:hypothetical protein